MKWLLGSWLVSGIVVLLRLVLRLRKCEGLCLLSSLVSWVMVVLLDR